MTQRATESITVNASPETIYAVVTDFAHYADWVSDLKRIDVVTRDDQGRALEVEFRAAAFGRSTTYTLPTTTPRRRGSCRWHQIQGDLTETLNGRYRSRPTARRPR